MPATKRDTLTTIAMRIREKLERYSRFVVIGLFLAALLTCAPDARAQSCEMPVSITPAAPTSATPITLTFRGYSQICSTLLYRVDGNVIRIDHDWNCLITPAFEQRELTIGTLPAGAYVVQFVSTLDDSTGAIVCGTFDVAADAVGEPIPTLTNVLLVLLATAVGLVGALNVKRIL